MVQTVTRIIMRASIPVLLIASMFSRFAGSYELLLDSVICLGAVIVVQRAVQSREYLWAAGFVPIAIVFSPFVLVVKIFLLMGVTCIATLAALFAVFRRQRLQAD
ncbi:MAG TPA: DUF6804 family protein [Candidatus Acidoferrales bacterium]|jgi:hypothetical protein|nr:DUF6804 family protein [Candidatus Acidoferrales bacterium]